MSIERVSKHSETDLSKWVISLKFESLSFNTLPKLNFLLQFLFFQFHSASFINSVYLFLNLFFDFLVQSLVLTGHLKMNHQTILVITNNIPKYKIYLNFFLNLHFIFQIYHFTFQIIHLIFQMYHFWYLLFILLLIKFCFRIKNTYNLEENSNTQDY